MRLILASSSPRRAELLSAAGFRFDALPVDVDERLEPGESPTDYVRRLASAKSARGLELYGAGDPNDPAAVIGADTTVVVDGVVLGKPENDGDAARMLHLLSGRTHEVMTGVSIRAGRAEAVAVATTTVWFSPLDPADVAWYVATGEGRDKAGAYAIQGLASRFIPRLDGSYSNVVGLPVALVAELLAEVAGEGPGSGFRGSASVASGAVRRYP